MMHEKFIQTISGLSLRMLISLGAAGIFLMIGSFALGREYQKTLDEKPLVEPSISPVQMIIPSATPYISPMDNISPTSAYSTQTPVPTRQPVDPVRNDEPWKNSVCGNGSCETCENECCNYPCKGDACPPPVCMGYCTQDCQ